MANILGVMLTVDDIEKMTQFFCKELAFSKVSETELSKEICASLYNLTDTKARFAILSLGNEYLYLIQFGRRGNDYPSINSNDLMFQHIAIVVSDLNHAHKQLVDAGIKGISSRPIVIPEWNKAAAGIMAYYFKSPEGHPLELIYFPADKGKPHWQTRPNLFLGIDHTAIVIRDTEKSLHFYRDKLGMNVFGESLNYGETQEALSNVSDAKVRITGLGYPGSTSMGLEFLHYLCPITGRAADDMSANDLGCTYTVIETNDFNELKNLSSSTGQFSPTDAHTIHEAMLGKDSDGHRLIIINKERYHAN